MDRRQFIKTMGLGALGLAVIPLIGKLPKIAEKLPALPVGGVIGMEEVSKEILGFDNGVPSLEFKDRLYDEFGDWPETTTDTQNWWYFHYKSSTTGNSSNG